MGIKVFHKSFGSLLNNSKRKKMEAIKKLDVHNNRLHVDRKENGVCRYN